MSEKNELTYILGAGASFESTPVVKSFVTRFSQFCGFLRNNSDYRNQLLSNEEKKDYVIASNEAHFFLNELKSYQSFDTLFKKWFHLGEIDLVKLGKKIMHIYFLWENFEKPEIQKPEDKNIFWKQSVRDKRYDALIAGLLEPQLVLASRYDFLPNHVSCKGHCFCRFWYSKAYQQRYLNIVICW